MQQKKRETRAQVAHTDYVLQPFSYQSGMTLECGAAYSVELIKEQTHKHSSYIFFYMKQFLYNNHSSMGNGVTLLQMFNKIYDFLKKKQFILLLTQLLLDSKKQHNAAQEVKSSQHQCRNQISSPLWDYKTYWH